MTDLAEIKVPASWAQRSLWLFAVRYPKAHLNEMVISLRLHGAIDLRAIEAAVTDLAQRHPTLRSRLTYEHGTLHHVVMPARPVPLPMTEVNGPASEGRLEAALALLAAPDRRPVNVIDGPTLVADLVKLGEDDHILCLRVHHAMCDGWSCGLILHDLGALYGARRAGRAADLPAVALQSHDVAAWEIATYESGGFASALDYWRGELENPPPKISLPTAAARKGNRDWGLRVVSRELSVSAGQDARAVARQMRVTPFSLWLTALATTIARATGQFDQLIGVPTLNRWSEEAMGFVGYASSLLPLRVRLDPALGFDKACIAVQASTRKMLAHGRVPLEVLLRETALSRLGNTVFPVWCQYLEGSSAASLDVAGLKISLMPVMRPSMLAELDIDVSGSEAGTSFDFSYRDSLFDARAMQRTVEDFFSILETALLTPQIRVQELLRRI